jgi:hypothetical protein
MFIYWMFRQRSGKQVIYLPSVLGNLLSEQANSLHEAGPYPMNWQPAAHASRGIYRGGDHQRQHTSNNRIDKKYLF